MKQISIRLDKRHDLDLITLYKGGINLGSILKKALYHYARGDRFDVVVEPVPRIDLKDSVKGKKLISGRDKLIHHRFEIALCDSESIRVLSLIRSVYGNTFCKQLIRNSILNLSLTPFFVTRKEASDKAAKIQSASDSWEYEDMLNSNVAKLDAREHAAFDELLENLPENVYIGRADGTLKCKKEKKKESNITVLPERLSKKDQQPVETLIKNTSPAVSVPAFDTLATLPIKSPSAEPDDANELENDDYAFLDDLALQTLS